MAFDYAALKTEITGDPLGRGYAGMTDAAVAASLNAADRPGPVPAGDVVKTLILLGRWPEIARIAQGRGTVPNNGMIRAAMTMWTAVQTFETFDLSDAAVMAATTAALDALVAAGLIVASDKAAVLALQDNRRTRAEELELWAVQPDDIARVRA